LLFHSISTDSNIGDQSGSAINGTEKKYQPLQFIFASKMGLYAKHMFSFNQELIKTEAEK